jgi:hypothetical protein
MTRKPDPKSDETNQTKNNTERAVEADQKPRAPKNDT